MQFYKQNSITLGNLSELKSLQKQTTNNSSFSQILHANSKLTHFQQ